MFPTMTVGVGGNDAGLTTDQLAMLRGRLEQLRAELRTRLEREQAVAREAEPEVEPLDAAEQTREQDDAILRADRDRAQLREVDNALRRMEEGTYGVSQISGEPISFERLRAVPWARYDSDEEPG
jgi:DnaK suppressor protein